MAPPNDKDLFLTIIRQNMKLIYKVCNLYCRDAEDRKDLVQEVIIQLWQSMDKYNEAYKLSTWMYRVALNVAISHYRRYGRVAESTVRFDEHIIDLADDYPEAETDANVTLLYSFINRFDELNKALMLLYLDNHTYKQIGEILGITETNVATKISRIKQTLKQQFTATNNQ